MKSTLRNILKAATLGLIFSLSVLPAQAQDSKGEIKKSGSEAKEAGKGFGKNVKHGRLVKGSKHLGKHMGKSGKHFGKSTAKLFKKVF